MESLLQAFDKYGVSLVILAAVLWMLFYVLKRLVNEDTGIVTTYVASTVNNNKSLTETMKTQAETAEKSAKTDEKMAELLETVEKRLDGIEKTSERLEAMHYDPHSNFASVTLGRCFRHSCDVAEMLANKLEIGEAAKPLIDKMRKELDDHEAIVSERARTA